MTEAPGGRPSAADRAFLDAEAVRLVDFARGSLDPRGGFGWLTDTGRVDLDRPLQTLVNARMTHVFGLAELLGMEGAGPLVDRGLVALGSLLRDDVHGGWWPEVDAAGHPVVDEKRGYDHAFVLLAASTAVQAGHAAARDLLAQAIEVVDEHFWDDDAGACVDVWDGRWTVLQPYRGANANMHAVEAFLAVHDATGDVRWLHRAARIAARVIDREARATGWRVPEHYDADWTPVPDFAREHPADPFRPYGATIGHGFEWARLLLHLDAALDSSLDAAADVSAPFDAAAPDVATDGPPAGEPREPWLVPAAVRLFDVAVQDGWSVDGAPGFVYTVDWDGVPVVRHRLHWVVAEAVAAAAALYQATGEQRYLRHYEDWWDYAQAFVMDPVRGSWHHELDQLNRPVRTVWEGKPDVYHALQATLLPRMPLAPSLAAALARRRQGGAEQG